MSVETTLKIKDDASVVIASIDKKIDSLTEQVAKFNNTPISPKTDSAQSRFEGLISTVGKLTIAVYGIQTAFNVVSGVVGTVANYSDTLSETTARLNLINDGLTSTTELWNEIYESANRSRGSITDMAGAVAKLGLLTDGVFANNREIVQFAENLTKSFKIAGTDAQGISSATLQLTQAMASGVLRGEELNSVFENAPLLVQNIANYMGVPIGQIRELASEGQITADIVKNAILGATDEINTQFESMPMKFEELGTAFSNVWYNNMSLIQEDMSTIPQQIADTFLPYWDAITYSIFADLDGIQQEQGKVVEQSVGMWEKLAQQIEDTSGIVTTKTEAMKINFLVASEFIESIMKKTGNIVIEIADVVIDAIQTMFSSLVYKAVESINYLAENIDNKLGTNFSSKTQDWVETWENKYNASKKDLETYENRLNDKFFGLTGKELYNTITQQAIDKVLGDKQKATQQGTETGYKTPTTSNIANNVSNIASNVSNISRGIDNLNGINKSIQEINEANYLNNVANQFNGNIQIVAYGADENAQKSIAEQTEQAVRNVFLNGFKNRTAAGSYA